MTDGIGLRIFKRILWWRYAADLWITRRILKFRGEERYYLRGKCNHCGRCCEYPSVQMNEFAYHVEIYRRMVIRWHRTVNGFKLFKQHKHEATLTFTCLHYDPMTRRCDSYSSRPGMCRDYPMNQIYSVNPHFFPECGFYAVDKRAGSFRAALEKTDLPPEKLEELYRKLHLEEDRSQESGVRSQ